MNDEVFPTLVLALIVAAISIVLGYKGGQQEILKTCETQGIYVTENVKMECKVHE